MNKQIEILLSTYNGASYLDEQLQSIIAQDIQDWHIVTRDDGSTDDSVQIIGRFAAMYPDRITVLKEPQARLGIVRSYECLLKNSSSPYIAFCDQDDVWFSDKLRLMRNAVLQCEEIAGQDTPILVHSDLQVVDRSLGKIADSFWCYQKLNPAKMQTLEGLLVQNCVTGCATLVNRSLVDCALPIPDGVVMHDWWLALLAASSGKIKSIQEQTVMYRQHAMNDVGAKHWSVTNSLRSLLHGRNHLRDTLLQTRNQAKALLESGKLYGKQVGIVSRYVSLFDHGYLFKRLEIIRMRFFKYGLVRNLGYFLRV